MTVQLRSAEELVRRVAVEPGLADKIKADPVNELQQVALNITKELPPALVTDSWVYRLVVIALGAGVLLAIIGAIVLAFKEGVEVPDLLTAIGSAAVGALAGLLAPSPAGKAAG